MDLDSTTALDDSLHTLQSTKGEWARLAIRERLQLLDQVRRDLWAVRDDWIEAELSAKDVPSKSLGVAEEWVLLGQAFRSIRVIQSALTDIEERGRPRIPGPIRSGPGGRSVLPVVPQATYDRLMFPGVTGEVWTEPGVTPEDIAERQALRYRDSDYNGAVALVLGAGNFSTIPLCDVFHKLFVDLQVVVLKMNPVNAHLGPVFEKALRSLIQRGFVRVAYGGAELGEYLCNHAAVEQLHMTGSARTYESIVFGTGPEGRRRKREHRPANTKPFTAELGNVSPVIVVPGQFRPRDIDECAKHVATWLVVNAGFACYAPRVIIQHESWAHRPQLSAAIRSELDRYPARTAYYPGASTIQGEFVLAHPEALRLGNAGDDRLPWTVIPDVDPAKKDDICFTREGFGGLCAEVSLEASTIDDYLDRAVEFANGTLWGTLSATLIVHPKSAAEPAITQAVERAIARLEYGTVSVNTLSAYGSYFMVCPWGGYPGHDMYDIQSGMGKNFNFLMIPNAEKTVLRAPFRRIDPITVRSRRPYTLAKRLAAFEAFPSPLKVPGLIAAGITT